MHASCLKKLSHSSISAKEARSAHEGSCIANHGGCHLQVMSSPKHQRCNTHLHCLANKTWWSKQYCQVEPDMSTGTAAKLQLPGNLIDDESWHIRPKNTTNACFVFEETESFSISKGGPECTWGVLHRESWSVPWKQAESRDSQLCRKLGTLMEHRKAWRMLRWGRGHPPIASSSSTSPQSPRRHPGSSSSPY